MTANDTDKSSARQGFQRWPSLVSALLGVGLLVWLGSGFFTVATNEKGVVVRFGSFRRVDNPGIHYAWPWPIDRVYTPRTTEVKRLEVGFKMLGKLSSEPRRSDTLTGDENILKVMMVVQYKIKDPVTYLFEAEQADWLVERAVECAVNQQIASQGVDDVLTTAKARIQIEGIATAQAWLDEYKSGIALLGGNLQQVVPPVPVNAAFKEVTDAKKDSDRAKDEARGYANRIIPQARGEARQIVSRAEGFYASRVNRARGKASRFESVLAEYRKAKQITRTRLFVEAMQEVFSRAKAVVLETHREGVPTKITIVGG